MKKIYIIVSTMLVSLFLVLSLQHKHEMLVFSSYNAVDVLGVETDTVAVSREEVTNRLNDLAKQTQSVIARRIVEADNHKSVRFVYGIYGEGELPQTLPEASKEVAENSDLANSYLILSGQLTMNQLRELFKEMGYRAVPFGQQSFLTLFINTVVSFENVLLCVILFLAFATLTLVSRIKSLRYSGIHFIAGQKYSRVVLVPVQQDVKEIGIAMLIGMIIGGALLMMFNMISLVTIILFMMGLILFEFSLFSISLLFSIIYLMSLRQSTLMDLIKGKLPLKRLMACMLFVQMIAVLIVGFVMLKMQRNLDDLAVYDSATQTWQAEKDWVNLTVGFSSGFRHNEVENTKRINQWYTFISEVIDTKKGMLIANRLDQKEMYQELDSDSFLGDTLFVTPEYLIAQKVPLDSDSLERLQQLQHGEYGVVIPETLKTDKLLQSIRDFMGYIGLETAYEDSRKLYDMVPIVYTTPTNPSYFLYHARSGNVIQQHIKDAILIVVTPQSLGESAPAKNFLYSEATRGLILNNYAETITLLKKHQIYPYISRVTNLKLHHLSEIEKLRQKTILLLIGGVFNLIASLLLFALMNQLYFEKFRREIFIKRISGKSFIAIHGGYILIQGVLLGISAYLITRITQQTWIGLSTIGIFGLAEMILLSLQVRQEQTMAVTILKGK